ncbi:MAG: hypothetical protein MI700_07245 [Balneolales bacterium]|nr:hypothetical protein [Balneolales bacterium]
MKNHLILIHVLIILMISCSTNVDESYSELEDHLLSMEISVFTSDEKYMAQTVHDYKINEVTGDTTFLTSFLIYQTSNEFQQAYDLDKECDFENLDECDDNLIEINFEEFVLMRELILEESLASYFVSYSAGYSAFQGSLEFIENDEDTVLVVKHYGTELHFDIFDQSKITYRSLRN